MLKINPLHDVIAILPLHEMQQHDVLFLAHLKANKGRPKHGVILGMGPGLEKKDGSRKPMPDVEVGDTVIYTAGLATEATDPQLKVTYELIHAHELICKVVED